MKFSQRKDLPRWLKPGWGELAQEGGREGWVLGAGLMNEPGAPSPTAHLWDLDKCLEPGGSGFKPCSSDSKAQAHPGREPHGKGRVARTLTEVASKDFFYF